MAAALCSSSAAHTSLGNVMKLFVVLKLQINCDYVSLCGWTRSLANCHLASDGHDNAAFITGSGFHRMIKWNPPPSVSGTLHRFCPYLPFSFHLSFSFMKFSNATFLLKNSKIEVVTAALYQIIPTSDESGVGLVFAVLNINRLFVLWISLLAARDH